MKLSELKSQILNRNIDDNLLIFKYNKSNFLCKQYANEIAKIKHLDISYIDCLDCLDEVSLFDVTDNSSELFILNINTFVVTSSSVDNFKNVIIICKEVEDELSLLTDYVVNFDELEKWQINDYMKTKCSGLKEEEITWLQTVSKDDINLIDNEISKICIFSKENQEKIFNLLNDEFGYCHLSSDTIFTLTNAIMKRDISLIAKTLSSIDAIDVEDTGLITILLNNFILLSKIQMLPNVSFETLKISSKQFNAIKYYNVNRYSNSEIKRNITFLSSLDYKIKTGKMLFNNNDLIYYVLCNILT